jgi:arylsulfate sulfotransferase
MLRVVRFCAAAMLGLSLFVATNASAAVKRPTVSITLDPSVPSPAMLGTSITWAAFVSGGPPGDNYDFQFSVTPPNGPNQIVRDFDVFDSFVWVPWQVEGTYTVTVVVRDISQNPYIVYPPVSVQYVLNPWVTQSGGSAVHPTAHPLVALFSAGPCPTGDFIRVRFHSAASLASMTTNSVACSNSSANFLVAGMPPSARYMMHWEQLANNQVVSSGTDQAFTTGPLPANFPAEHFTVNVPPTPRDAAFPVVLFHLISLLPTATDVAGHVIWYFPSPALITRIQPGGNIFTTTNTQLSGWDLAGNLVMQTNYEILNEQLLAKGYPQMTSLNIHETRILPNGNIAILGARDETSTVYQGGTPQHPVDILGDMILVLDHNMQLLWAWDSFSHQDLSRVATLNDKCYQGAGGCPLFNPNFSVANDWTHSNALQFTADGNILISERSQDWVFKINYANGTGDGSVIWRLGPDGDFTIVNPLPNPCGDPNVFSWFTHQHDSALQRQNVLPEIFTVFDDGNLRVQQCGGGNSRGMVLYVSEPTRKVFIQTAADLGAYSPALGSAQLLSSPYGTYGSFGNGFLSGAAQVSEVDLSGHIVYQLQANDNSYRIYRQRDLYTPTLP